MKMYQHKFAILTIALLASACEEKEESITFEPVTAEKTLALSYDPILENFILSNTAITFIYNPDEIAPYSLSSIELTIGMPAIEKLLKSSFEH